MTMNINPRFIQVDIWLILEVIGLVYGFYLVATKGATTNNIGVVGIFLVAMFADYLFRRRLITNPKFNY